MNCGEKSDTLVAAPETSRWRPVGFRFLGEIRDVIGANPQRLPNPSRGRRRHGWDLGGPRYGSRCGRRLAALTGMSSPELLYEFVRDRCTPSSKRPGAVSWRANSSGRAGGERLGTVRRQADERQHEGP